MWTSKIDHCRKKIPRSFHTNSGFTLLEIMVAISIIAVALVSVYRMHSQTLTMNFAARFYTTAPLLAQLKLAELENQSMEDLVNDSGDFGEDYSGFRWDVVVNDVESESLESVAKDLKRIDVTVSFNDDEFTYDLRTYRIY